MNFECCCKEYTETEEIELSWRLFRETDLNWYDIDNSCVVFKVHQASSNRGSSGISARNTCLPNVQLNHPDVSDTIGISEKTKQSPV